MAFKILPSDHELLSGMPRPEMMAIGDSIYNGTQSLTTSVRHAQGRCRHWWRGGWD
ncbi:hypothetical protein ACFQ4K_05185 [Tistrella bauzanensis]